MHKVAYFILSHLPIVDGFVTIGQHAPAWLGRYDDEGDWLIPAIKKWEKEHPNKVVTYKVVNELIRGHRVS